mgnify:FL=1|jgi:hypothetical protein
MIGFYTAIDKLKAHFDADALVNSVSEGDIFQVDLAKQTIFPLVHIMVNSCTFEVNVLRFNISLIAMDLVDISKNENTNVYLGNDNTQDALNSTLAILNRAYDIMLHGSLAYDLFQIDGNPTCEPFTERFENLLSGWTMTFDVLVPNEMTIC